MHNSSKADRGGVQWLRCDCTFTASALCPTVDPQVEGGLRFAGGVLQLLLLLLIESTARIAPGLSVEE